MPTCSNAGMQQDRHFAGREPNSAGRISKVFKTSRIESGRDGSGGYQMAQVGSEYRDPARPDPREGTRPVQNLAITW